MGHLLVVEDDEAVRRALARIITRYRVPHFVGSAVEALEVLDTREDWCGFMIDLALGGNKDEGFEILQHVRERYPDVPAALVTGRIELEVVNRAATMNSAVLGKPVSEAVLTAFLKRVVARDNEFSSPLASRLEAVASSWKLSHREYEVVAWLVAGGTRDSFILRTGMAPTTFRSHMKHILRKSGAASFADLLSLLLKRMFAHDELPLTPSEVGTMRAGEAADPEGELNTLPPPGSTRRVPLRKLSDTRLKKVKA